MGSFRVEFSTTGKIVKVCKLVCRRKESLYFPEPTSEILGKSAAGIENIWKFLNCTGSLDVEHVTMSFEASNMGQRFEAGLITVLDD